MSVAFDTLYPYIRAVLGDSNAQKQLYADSTLDQHLLLYGLMHSPRFDTDEDNLVFVNDLTSKEKSIVIFSVARAIVSPDHNFFSYKTPILSVQRSGGVMQLVTWIDNSLRRLQAAELIGYSNEFDAILNGPNVFLATFSRAIDGRNVRNTISS